jgi:hypothetical protein
MVCSAGDRKVRVRAETSSAGVDWTIRGGTGERVNTGAGVGAGEAVAKAGGAEGMSAMKEADRMEDLSHWARFVGLAFPGTG